MRPSKVGADAGGHHTTMVYRWCRRMGLQDYYPIFGRESGNTVFWQGEPQDLRTRRGQVIKRGMRPWFTNTSRVKSDFYGWLQADYSQGEVFGKVHIPHMPDHWYQQLTAEELVTTFRKGYAHTEWRMPLGVERNEALDTRVGCQALAEHLGLTKMSDSQWRVLEDFYGQSRPETTPAAEVVTANAPTGTVAPGPVVEQQRAEPEYRRSSWIRPGGGRWL